MPKEKILPTILMLIDIGAAVMYMPTGDWRKVCYWLAASILTGVVTW